MLAHFSLRCPIASSFSASLQVTDAEFRSHFAQFGEIVEAMVMFDRQTQRSRGFGFVTYQDIGSIDKVSSSLFKGKEWGVVLFGVAF